jgi:ATP/ADP translocase/HEAT repeat protein
MPVPSTRTEPSPTTTPLSRLATALLVRPGEERRTALLFAHLLLASAVFVMGRTVRDTLFLSRFSIDALPWMFVLYGVASAITVVVYARVADRLPRERSIVVWCVVGVMSYLGTWLAVQAALAWVYPVFYVWSEVFANLAISQFWTLANELHDPRAGKRLFGTIGAARVLGVIVVGLGTGVVVRAIGTPQLLFVLAGLQLAIGALATALSREPRPTRAPSTAKSARPAPAILSSRYVWALSAMLLFAFAALTVGDFQFKAIARATYQEDDLAQFFSYFYAATGIVSFLFQIIVTPRLLARFGVGAGMSVMPAVFGTASAVLFGAPLLPVATVMKFADNGFQYTIHDTTLQALYVPFPAASRARTRAFLDAVAKPLAYGVGGLALVLFAHRLPTEQLSAVSFVLVVGWALCIPIVRRLYRRELERTLGGAPTEDVVGELAADADTQELLESALGSSDERVVLAAIGEAALVPSEVVLRPIARAVEHPSPAVRIAAMDFLSARGSLAREHAIDPAPLRASLRDPLPEVRAAAATALASSTADDANDLLVPLLDDDARSVRSAALAAILVHGGLDGAMTGGERLHSLARSSTVADRIDAAAVLEALGPPGYRRLRELLDDPDPRVRRAAVRASRGCPDRRLVDPLLAALSDRRTEAAATAGLAAIGVAAAPRLVAMLASPLTARRTRLQIPRILRQIPCEESWQGLRSAMRSPDSHLRLRAFSALSTLRVRLEHPPAPLDEVRALVEREIRETLGVLVAWSRARRRYPSELFDEAIAFREVRGSRRVLRILELRYPVEVLRLVRERLESPARRANALELLDNTIEPALRPVVMPFFDDAPIDEKAQKAGLEAVPEALAFLESQLAHENPYVVALAFDVLAREEPALAARHAAQLLHGPRGGHADPLVREAAIHAVVRADRAAAPEQIAALVDDPDPVVRRVARAAIERCRSRGDEEVPVESTIEKLLALRAAPVFAKLRSEDLAVLARIAEIETFERDATIFAEGEMGDALFVVVRGAVDIRREGRLLATLKKGEAFGEMAVLDAQPRSATATAAERTEVLRIGSEDFYDSLHEQAEIAEGIIRMLSARLREANEALERERGSHVPAAEEKS